jgi:peptidyl-prolyl cis-trans isomerase SurA
MIMRRILTTSLSVLLLAAFSFAGDTVIEDIVARVNSGIITRSELQRNKEQTLNDLKQQPGSEINAADAEKNALRDLIDQQLLVQKAADLGLSADTDVVKQLDDMRKKSNLDTIEDLEKEAAKQGINWEEFKQNLKNNILTQMVISREVGPRIQITSDEEKKFYEEHKDKLSQPERVRLSEILISTSKKDKDGNDIPMSDQEIAIAESKAKQLADELKKGAKFDDLARKNSDGPTAGDGGDLGYFQRGQLAKELEDKTFAMKPGEFTEVTRTKQGFEILKVTEHNQAGIPPLKDVEPKIQEAIYLQKLQPKLREYLTKLREDAYIDIKPGFVDTGASPNETKPIMTAANAPEQGKDLKKKKKKLGIF